MDDKLKPMLAININGDLSRLPEEFTATEKLDGNRLSVRLEDGGWIVRTRGGNVVDNINLDMSRMANQYIYDGELVHVKQYQKSMQIRQFLRGEIDISEIDKTPTRRYFQMLNGELKKSKPDMSKMVYVIFDCLDKEPTSKGATYLKRREILDKFKTIENQHVKILGTLMQAGRNFGSMVDLPVSFDADAIIPTIEDLFRTVIVAGGEGLMINDNNALYVNGVNDERTSVILKYKHVETMDMLVEGVNLGSKTNPKWAKDLNLTLTKSNGDVVKVVVGNGLSRLEKELFGKDPSQIIGKIVEVNHYGLTQNKKNQGTKNYSLRHANITVIRHDKTSTSEH